MSLTFCAEKLKKAHPLLGSCLALDTSSALSVISCYDASKKIVYETTCPSPSKPSESILLSIKSCLKKAGVNLHDLEALLVGLGPGSFTGLRVGLATMKGLALGTQIQLHGFCSLHVWALSCPADLIIALRNAQRGELFAGGFKRQKPSGALEPLFPVHLCSPQSLANHLDSLSETNITLIGEASSLVMPYLNTNKNYHIGNYLMSTTHAYLCCQKAILSQEPLALEELTPTYLRQSAAEENSKSSKQ